MKKGMTELLALAAGTMTGAIVVGKKLNARVNEKQKLSDKHLSLFIMMNQWVKVKQAGKNLETYFNKNGYKEIAIYGMNYAGKTLLEELRESEIIVKYGIDQNADDLYADIDILKMDCELEKVDAVVVTPITFFDEIEENLRHKVDCPIISLEDILYQV